MKTFNQIVNESFAIPEGEIRDDMSSKDVPNWDSMNYLMFISALENEYAISFTMDDVMKAETLGDLRRLVEKYTPRT